MIIVVEMDTGTYIQILNEDAFLLHSVNFFWERYVSN